MIRRVSAAAVTIAAILAGALSASAAASAEPRKDVADAFIAAAQAQDRQAALNLLAADASIAFPAGADRGRQGYGEGQPFVIGYLDGLFGAERGLSVDSAAPEGDAVRFLAHENRSRHERYAIDVEVEGHQVVKVTVNLQDEPAALAALADPAT
ncbi:MAG TPA: hypothetical protein VGM25_18135 [Caulobacteraceae bacterium]|jgi:hypothetical protein